MPPPFLAMTRTNIDTIKNILCKRTRAAWEKNRKAEFKALMEGPKGSKVRALQRELQETEDRVTEISRRYKAAREKLGMSTWADTLVGREDFYKSPEYAAMNERLEALTVAAALVTSPTALAALLKEFLDEEPKA